MFVLKENISPLGWRKMIPHGNMEMQEEMNNTMRDKHVAK